jgi:CubicO group peptidase (beta-lactamase class C family)
MTADACRRRAHRGIVVAMAVTGTVAGFDAQDSRSGVAAPGFDAAIAKEMASVGAPGAAVAVVVGDKVVWSKGFGLANAETGAPVTADTLFQIGSVTKTFTAAALLSASTQGVVALDRPVSTYVSGLVPCVGAPTLLQLL